MALTNLNSVYSLKSGLAKNYITTGDMEVGSSALSSWSLVNTTLSANFFPNSVVSAAPFSLTNGGTAASSNLSTSLLSGGSQIAGSYSLGLTQATTAGIAGDMLISQAWTIDPEDRAKTLTFRFAYSVLTGLSNLAFTGANTGTFAVYIFDVANGAWLQPSGTFAMTSGSTPGYATGTFQSAANATSYQIAIITINATAGAYSMAFDDFFIGPQNTILGPQVGDSVLYGVNTVGITSGTPPTFGTVVTNKLYGKRTGDVGTVSCIFEQNTAGTAGTATQDYLWSLPTGWSFNLNVYPAYQGNIATQMAEVSAVWKSNIPASGFISLNGADYAFMAGVIPWSATQFRVNIDYQIGADQFCQGSGLAPFSTAGLGINFSFSAPMAGWSSNSVLSSDTTNRRIGFVANTSSTAATSSSPFIYSNVVLDDMSGYNSTTGQYKIQVAGLYLIYGSALTGATTNAMSIRRNATVIFTGEETTTQRFSVTGLYPCAVGDLIDIVPANAATASGGAPDSSFFICLVQGPSTATAADSVNMRYYASSTTISGSLATVVFSTKDYDSHAQMGAVTAGVYNVPVPGKYQFNLALALTAASAAAGNAVDVQVQKNGVVVSEISPVYQSTQTVMPIYLSDEISCVAGDQIRVQVSSAATTPSIVSSNSKNYFSLMRTGN